MIYCIDPTVEEPIMLINKHIGFDENEGQGVDGSLFQEELLALDGLGKKRIQVWINSPGGIVMDGYNIYNAILKSKTKVDTYCVGIAASISAVIFQAGRNRIMADYSLLMYHDPYGGSDSQELEKMKLSIAKMIATRTGNSEASVLKMMAKTTWITAAEALETGFCDSIEETSEQNKKRSTGDIKAMWTQGNAYVNSLFNKTKNKTMIKVANKLGLNAEANEESILSAITAIENKKASAEDKLAKMEDEYNKMKTTCDEMESKVKELKAKLEEEAKAKMEAEEKAEEEKAKNMFSEYVKQGRIKNEAVIDWVNTAKAIGFDKAKNMIEALPLNKVSNKIDTTGSATEASLTNVVANAMANLRVKNNI